MKNNNKPISHSITLSRVIELLDHSVTGEFRSHRSQLFVKVHSVHKMEKLFDVYTQQSHHQALLSCHKCLGVRGWEPGYCDAFKRTQSLADVIFRECSLNPEGYLSHCASSFLLLSEAAAKQWSIGNMSQATNKECLQGHRTVREHGEEEKEMDNKAKDGSEEGQKVVYTFTIFLK